MTATSEYLNRPLRTLAEVERDRDRPESKLHRMLIPFLRTTK